MCFWTKSQNTWCKSVPECLVPHGYLRGWWLFLQQVRPLPRLCTPPRGCLHPFLSHCSPGSHQRAPVAVFMPRPLPAAEGPRGWAASGAVGGMSVHAAGWPLGFPVPRRQSVSVFRPRQHRPGQLRLLPQRLRRRGRPASAS